MKGNFLEACFNEDFVLGAKSPPPMGYHICGVDLRLGIVADPDKDGWLTGTPKFIGDYVVPGSPLEGWALKVDTNYTFNYPGYKLYGGRYVGRVSTGSKQSIVYQADFKGLEIIQTAIIDVDKLYILIDVKLKNTGTTKLKDIFYSRFVDPDNEQCLTADFATKMKIDNQLPNLRQHVTVSSVGKTYNSYCALHTRDCRARVVIDSTGLYGVTFYPDSLYNALPGSSRYLVKEGDTITGDKGMALIFKIGDLDTNETAGFSFAYVMDEKEVDSIFYDETRPLWFFSGNTYSDYDTLHVCDSGLYPIAIAATGSIDWQWESNPLLDTNFGPSNVFLAKGMQLFKAWRPDILACSGYDTLHIYIKTDSFKAPIFNTGKTLFTTGVYKSYQWFRNEIPLPGATDSFYNAIDTGTYKILVEGESGCSFFTDTIKIYPALNTDYFKIEKGEIFAYPTPASEKLMFHVAFDVNVRIVNLNGIEVLRKNACREMDLSGIANGVYFVVIFDVSGQYLGKQKIIKAG